MGVGINDILFTGEIVLLGIDQIHPGAGVTERNRAVPIDAHTKEGTADSKSLQRRWSTGGIALDAEKETELGIDLFLQDVPNNQPGC